MKTLMSIQRITADFTPQKSSLIKAFPYMRTCLHTILFLLRVHYQPDLSASVSGDLAVHRDVSKATDSLQR